MTCIWASDNRYNAQLSAFLCPAAKRILVHFEAKSTHIVIRNSATVTNVKTLFFLPFCQVFR